MQRETETQTSLIMKKTDLMQQGVMNAGIGRIIKHILKEKGCTVVWFAERLKCSRTNVYKIFEKRSINTDELMRISLILNYDFFRLYSEELNKGTNQEDLLNF